MIQGLCCGWLGGEDEQDPDSDAERGRGAECQDLQEVAEIGVLGVSDGDPQGDEE